jgi:hypothetical protein
MPIIITISILIFFNFKIFFWHHIKCFFDQKNIFENINVLEDLDILNEDEQLKIKAYFSDLKIKQANSSCKMSSNDLIKTTIKRGTEEFNADLVTPKRRKLDNIVLHENNKNDIDKAIIEKVFKTVSNENNHNIVIENSILKSEDKKDSNSIENFENSENIVSNENSYNIVVEKSILKSNYKKVSKFENDKNIVTQGKIHKSEDAKKVSSSFDSDNNKIKVENKKKTEMTTDHQNKSETDNLIKNYNEYEIDFSSSNNTKCVECKKSKSSIPKVSLNNHNLI